MEKITVVVPIYNVEKYLRKCFDSLLDQTFEEYVIYAVNDGSPDNSKVIIDEYASKYPNKIIAIDKENGGYGSVLQLAISKMKSPYFLICDPDDYLDKNTLSNLYDLASLSDADITIGAKYFIYEGSDDKDYDYAYNREFTTLKPNFVYNHNTKAYDDILFVDPSPHSKLYKTKVAKNISFVNKVGYTDNMLFYLSYLNSNKIIYSDKPYAYYLVDRKGNTMTDVRPKAISAHVSVFKEIVNQHNKERASDMFYYRMFESFKFIVEQVKRVDGSYDDVSLVIDELYTFLEKLIPYKPRIKKEYKKHSNAQIIERMKDMRLLDKKASTTEFNRLKNRLLLKYQDK